MVTLRKNAQIITQQQFLRVVYLGLVIFVLGVFIFVGWRATHGSSRLAKGVTVESIHAVQNGMTEEEVVAILGDPVERAPSVNYPDAVTLTYSKPAYFAKWYPMLWQQFQLWTVFRKLNFFCPIFALDTVKFRRKSGFLALFCIS